MPDVSSSRKSLKFWLMVAALAFLYYIGDVITDPEELTLQTPESFFKRFRINMKIHHEVISIHSECKTVSVKNLENEMCIRDRYIIKQILTKQTELSFMIALFVDMSIPGAIHSIIQ